MTTAAKVRAVAALARLAKTTPRPPLAAVTLCPSLHDGSRQADIAAVLREALRRIDGARVVVFSRSNLFRVALASHGTHRRKPACGPGEVLETRYPLQHFSCELPHVVAYRANLYFLPRGSSPDESRRRCGCDVDL